MDGWFFGSQQRRERMHKWKWDREFRGAYRVSVEEVQAGSKTITQREWDDYISTFNPVLARTRFVFRSSRGVEVSTIVSTAVLMETQRGGRDHFETALFDCPEVSEYKEYSSNKEEALMKHKNTVELLVKHMIMMGWKEVSRSEVLP
jgi:hypothetical protein